MTAKLYKGADASTPKAALPSGYLIVAGYVGAPELPGQPDTPHVWTAAEWNQYLDPASPLYVPGCRALPIYTHDYPGDPVQDAANAMDAAADLGWDADRGSRVMAWDSEFLSDPGYCAGLRRALNLGGWLLMTYEKTALQDPPTDLRWLFHIQGLHSPPPRSLPAGADGLQWTFAGAWDLDLFSQRVYDLCGQGPRIVPKPSAEMP